MGNDSRVDLLKRLRVAWLNTELFLLRIKQPHSSNPDLFRSWKEEFDEVSRMLNEASYE